MQFNFQLNFPGRQHNFRHTFPSRSQGSALPLTSFALKHHCRFHQVILTSNSIFTTFPVKQHKFSREGIHSQRFLYPLEQHKLPLQHNITSFQATQMHYFSPQTPQTCYTTEFFQPGITIFLASNAISSFFSLVTQILSSIQHTFQLCKTAEHFPSHFLGLASQFVRSATQTKGIFSFEATQLHFHLFPGLAA